MFASFKNKAVAFLKQLNAKKNELVASAAAALVMISGTAHATLDPTITGPIATALTDGAALAVSVVAVFASIKGIKWLSKGL